MYAVLTILAGLKNEKTNACSLTVHVHWNMAFTGAVYC